MNNTTYGETSVYCGALPQIHEHNSPVYDQIKEEICFAYLQHICAYIGAELKRSGRPMDNGKVDATVSLPRGEGRSFPLHLDVQLKCTSVPNFIDDEHISYQIDRELFDGLSSKNKSVPWLLFILILPEDVESWVSVEQNELIARGSMLWYDATGQVIKPDAKSTTVHIPVSNKVNKDSLYHFLIKQTEGKE